MAAGAAAAAAARATMRISTGSKEKWVVSHWHYTFFGSERGGWWALSVTKRQRVEKKDY